MPYARNNCENQFHEANSTNYFFLVLHMKSITLLNKGEENVKYDGVGWAGLHPRVYS